MAAPSIPEALAQLRLALAAQAPGFLPTALTIHGVCGGAQQKMKLPFLDAPAAPAAAPTVTAASADVFIPSAFQEAILGALEGKALRTDALASAIGGDCRSRIFRKPGGIQELIDQDYVRNHPRRGYYRVDAPPPELASPPE